jgi:hypothetical protein
MYLFMYLFMRSAAQTIYRRMRRWHVNDELDRLYKEAVVA